MQEAAWTLAATKPGKEPTQTLPTAFKHSFELPYPPTYTYVRLSVLCEMPMQEAAWTLAATKSGEEPRYQGLVSGSISITNSKAVPVVLYGVLTAIKGGPSATVTCGPAMPFKVSGNGRA
jgi:hypothetical protein